MLKAFVFGIVLGAVLLAAGVYFYFSSGRAPVTATASEMPFEHKLAHMALDAYLEKQPHPGPQVPADEKNLLAGAEVYKEHCAVCHGLPDQEPTAIAAGMFPKPPRLFKGVGVTDDEAWETYWKVEGGIRLTGMPGFKGRLTEPQIWQVTVLVKNADKIPASVKSALSLAPKSDAPAAVASAQPQKPRH